MDHGPWTMDHGPWTQEPPDHGPLVYQKKRYRSGGWRRSARIQLSLIPFADGGKR
jgi:hypothetical protein